MTRLVRLRVAPARDRLLGASELVCMRLASLPSIGTFYRIPLEPQLYEVVAIQADVAWMPGTSDRGPVIYLVPVREWPRGRGSRRTGGTKGRVTRPSHPPAV